MKSQWKLNKTVSPNFLLLLAELEESIIHDALTQNLISYKKQY